MFFCLSCFISLFFVFVFISIYLYFSLSNSSSLSFSLSFSLSPFISPWFSLFLSLFVLSLSLSLYFYISLTISLYLSPYLSQSISLSLSITLSHSLSLVEAAAVRLHRRRQLLGCSWAAASCSRSSKCLSFCIVFASASRFVSMWKTEPEQVGIIVYTTLVCNDIARKGRHLMVNQQGMCKGA